MAAGDFKWDSAKDGCCRMGLQSASLEHINCEHIIRQRCSFLCEPHSVKRVLPQFPHTWHVITLLHCVLLKCTFWFEVKIPVSTKHLSPEEKNKQTLMKLRTPDLDTAKPMAPAVTPPVPCPSSRGQLCGGNPNPTSSCLSVLQGLQTRHFEA